MALRDVIIDTDPMLRKKSRDVADFDSKLHKLLDDMKETMIHNDGIGLAAPQVAILRRVAVIRTDDEEYIDFINPVILESEGEQICNEACLSVPDRRNDVLRPMSVKVKAFDRNGVEFIRQFDGIDANVCCHEFDHLDGVLFYDKMFKDEKEEELQK